MEVWKQIDGFEYYEISNQGRIRSYWNNRHDRKEEPHLVKCWSTKFGHLVVALSTKEIKDQRFYVHRLVGKFFLENPHNKRFIDHIDRNPSNNYVSNLRWVDHCENMANVAVSKNNKCGEKNIHYSAKGKGHWVVQIMRRGVRFQKQFDTLEKAITARDKFLDNNK